jgi:ubiquinone/menaquinone biosynthesis C-methylase UbiE
MNTIYQNDKHDRATRTEFLEKRLEINKALASADFDGWLFERLQVAAGEDVLDVGCGTGAQSVRFATLVQPGGSVSALDLSGESIALLKERVGDDAPVDAVAADMADLETVIERQFSVKTYDLAHSSYALYYSPRRIAVLDVMRSSLKPGGRCAVFTPNEPHGLVEFVSKFTKIPKPVGESLKFGTEILKPYFGKHFPSVEVHHFNNVITNPTADHVIEFYRQTTYYDADAETPMRYAIEDEIERTGSFRYEKNGYLIIGRTQ